MEFPDLGEHCSFPNCKQLDFLPVKCDACQQIFCKDHYSYVHHNCPKAILRDNQVPVCPLCNRPIPIINKGESADLVVGRHIDNDCQSDVAEKQRRKVYGNKCNVKGCKQKEMIKVECDRCQLNFCLRHRLDLDHDCKGFQGSGKTVSKSGIAALSRAQQLFKSATTTATTSTQQQQKSQQQKQQQQQLQQQRQQQRQQPRATALHVHSLQQPGLREEEAINRAIQLSLQETSHTGTPNNDGANGGDDDDDDDDDDDEVKRIQRESDEALARALQESEMMMMQRQSVTAGNTTNTPEKPSNCYIS